MTRPGSPAFRVTMSDRVPISDLVHNTALLLNRLAVKDHPGLKEPDNAKRVYPNTAVIVQRHVKGDPARITFGWFVTGTILGARAPDNRVDALMSVNFHVEDFHKDPLTYLANMIKSAGQKMSGEGHFVPDDPAIREALRAIRSAS